MRPSMAVLTKENYEAIAAILKAAKDKETIITLLVEYFKVNNPRFDATQFLRAVKAQPREMARASPLDVNEAIDLLGRQKEATFPWAGSKRSYELRRAGLGKFESGFLVDRWVYGLSLEEGVVIGDVTEVGWAVVPVTLGPDAVKDVREEAKRQDDIVTPDEEAFISDMFGAMVVEDDQGFVDVEYFETEREWLDKQEEWERAEEEFREGEEE